MADDIYVGGKQIPNPKGIEVHSDTDVPASAPKNKRVQMNISNPPASSVIPKHPVEDLFEMKGIRHQPGPSVPKDHPAIQVSEN